MTQQPQPNTPDVGGCPILMQGDKPCGRELLDKDDCCILHSEDLHKDVDRFRTAIREIFQDTKAESHDFTGVIFQTPYAFIEDFDKPVYFVRSIFRYPFLVKNVKFHHSVSFSKAEFHGTVAFIETVFSGVADFQSARFVDSVRFEHVVFDEEVGFGSVKFNDSVSFSKCEFDGDAKFVATEFHSTGWFFNSVFRKSADFLYCDCRSYARILFIIEKTNEAEKLEDKEMFVGRADFGSVSVRDHASCQFVGVSVERCEFNGANVDRMEFHHVLWPVVDKWFGRHFGRKAIFDETHIYRGGRIDREECEEVARTYQLLQVGLMNRFDFHTASDFYIGEQEMKRKAKNRFRRVFSITNGYRLLSNYGQSFLRPFGWFVSTLITAPLALLWGGVKLSNGSVTYQPSWGGEFLLGNTEFLGHWCEAIRTNILLVLNRYSITDYLTGSGQHVFVALESIWLVALVTMFVLALSRKFKRKAF